MFRNNLQKKTISNNHIISKIVFMLNITVLENPGFNRKFA